MEDIENIGSKGTPPFNIPLQEVAGVISPSMPLVSYIVWISMQFHCLKIELQPMQRCQHPATAALRCGGVEGHLAPPAKLLHVGPEPLVPHLLLYINHMLRPFHPSFFCISTTNADLHYSYLSSSFSDQSVSQAYLKFRLLSTMSSYDSNRDSAAQKAEEAKNVGQKKAGEAQQATKVRS